MSENMVILTIVLMALATMLSRVLPFVCLGGRELPRRFVSWIRYVPVAVLSGMLAPELFLREGQVRVGLENLELWVGIPTFVVAAVTRSLFFTVAAGIALLAVARACL